jgi:heme exporter protein A
MNMHGHSLSIESLACLREDRLLFSDLSLQIHSGDLLIIEGPNGSGKSTLLRLLTGLATPTAGEVHWQQQSIVNHPVYREHMHYIGHLNGIKSGLTVEENLHLMQQLTGTTVSVDQAAILRTLNLIDHRQQLARHLSAGQKRRLALAKLFLLKKPLWLLDEPLTAIDTATETLFITQLEQHLQTGGIAVISTHHPIPLQYRSIKKLRLPLC